MTRSEVEIDVVARIITAAASDGPLSKTDLEKWDRKHAQRAIAALDVVRGDQVARIVRFLADAGYEAAAATVEIEFGAQP